MCSPQNPPVNGERCPIPRWSVFSFLRYCPFFFRHSRQLGPPGWHWSIEWDRWNWSWFTCSRVRCPHTRWAVPGGASAEDAEANGGNWPAKQHLLSGRVVFNSWTELVTATGCHPRSFFGSFFVLRFCGSLTAWSPHGGQFSGRTLRLTAWNIHLPS